jgi:hypothetical protein
MGRFIQIKVIFGPEGMKEVHCRRYSLEITSYLFLGLPRFVWVNSGHFSKF